MQDYQDKFLASVQNKFVSGTQHQQIPFMVNQAKFYEIDLETTLSIIRNNWSGTFDKGDEMSLRNAWKKCNPEKTISQYDKKKPIEKVKEITKNSNNLNQNQIDLNLDILKSELSKVEIKEYNLDLTETTEDLTYWFDENDIIWISSSYISSGLRDFKDLTELTVYNRPLNIYSYMCVNPFRGDAPERTDESVSKFNYLLLESDTLELTLQMQLWQDMIDYGVPIKSVIFSGGKSFHTLIKLHDISTVEEYKEYANKLIKLFESYIGVSIDKACCNPSRLTRSPFGTYDKEGENKGKEQELFYLNPNNEIEGDAYKLIESYFKNKLHLRSSAPEISKDKITESELLFYVDRSIVFDIWCESSKFYWRIKDFSGRTSYIQEYFISRTRLNECAIQFIDKKYKSVLIDPKDLQDFTVQYKQIIFQPCLKKDLYVNDKIVNVFRPGNLSEIINDKNIPDKLNTPLEVYLNNLFGDNEVERKWTLQWMRHYMHNFKKMLTAPVFWDKPGIGKSMLAEAFGRSIGNWASPKQSQIEDNRFNAWIKNAVIILDEVSCGSKKDGKAFGDYLKGLITQEMQTIEHKGRDLIETFIPNCFIFTANTNNYIPPVFLEENDRRYTIIRNDNSKNLMELWTDEDFIKWNSGEYQNILIKYIYNLPEDKSVNLNHGLVSKYKTEVLEMSKNKFELVAEDIYKEFVEREFISNEELKDYLKENYDNDIKFDIIKKILIKQYGCEMAIKKTSYKMKLHATFRGLKFNNKEITL